MKFQKLIISLCLLVFILPLVSAYNLDVICNPSTVNVGDTVTCNLVLSDTSNQGDITGPFGSYFVIDISTTALSAPGTGTGGIELTAVYPGLNALSSATTLNSALVTFTSDTISLAQPVTLATFQLSANQVGSSVVSLTGLSIAYGPTSASDPSPATSSSTVTVSTTTTTPVCGNSVLETGEQCDDGNTANGDGCSSTCQTEVVSPVCGNSVLETGEQCDDGNTANDDGCSSTCQTEVTTTTCTEGDNIAATGCVCNLENVNGVCTGIVGRIRDILDNPVPTRLAKLSMIASELRTYFFG